MRVSGYQQQSTPQVGTPKSPLIANEDSLDELNRGKSTNSFEGKEVQQSLTNSNEESVIQAIENANKMFKDINTNLKFSIHKETRQIMVKVINSETNEVIREIPPEKVLDMVAKMWKQVGILVDKKG